MHIPLTPETAAAHLQDLLREADAHRRAGQATAGLRRGTPHRVRRRRPAWRRLATT